MYTIKIIDGAMFFQPKSKTRPQTRLDTFLNYSMGVWCIFFYFSLVFAALMWNY